MREILCRGKKKKNNEWIEGRIVGEGTVIIPKGQLFYIDVTIDKFDAHNDLKSYFILPETAGQFIGLTDKNGKNIFEGDIVNCKTTNYYFECFAVEWCQEQCRFVIANDKNDEIRSFPIDENFEYEVIGNIHDNPELLRSDTE